MARTVEIILGYVEKPVGAGLAATSLVDQYNSDTSGFALVNQSTQTGAAVAGVTSIVKLTAGFTPFLAIQTNTLAATTVLLKITAEYRTNQSFQYGDVISLVGNVAGIVGGLTILAGGGPVAVVFTAVGVAASFAGILNADITKSLHASLIEPVWKKHFAGDPNSVYPDYWLTPDLRLASVAQIKASFGGKIAVAYYDLDKKTVVVGGEGIHEFGVFGEGGGYF